MREVAVLCACLGALGVLGGCGVSTAAEAGTTAATMSGLALTVDGEPTGDVWTAMSGLGGHVESFTIGPFNSKESSDLQQSVTIRAERIVWK